MSKCKECGQDVSSTPIVVDATGREVKVTDVILWMNPQNTTTVGTMRLTCHEKPITFEPVVLFPTVIESDTQTLKYVLYARTHPSRADAPIHGRVGKRNPYIYRLDRSMRDFV